MNERQDIVAACNFEPKPPGLPDPPDPRAAPDFGQALEHASETVRLWVAGEQTNPWPEQDANLAAAYLALREKHNRSLAYREVQEGLPEGAIPRV